MRESPFYQEILEEGRQEGRQEGYQEGKLWVLRKMVPILQGSGFPVERILGLLGITLAELGLEEESSRQ